jgi:hypothetical protein
MVVGKNKIEKNAKSGVCNSKGFGFVTFFEVAILSNSEIFFFFFFKSQFLIFSDISEFQVGGPVNQQMMIDMI